MLLPENRAFSGYIMLFCRVLFVLGFSLVFTRCGWFSDYTYIQVDFSHIEFPWEINGFRGGYSVVYPDPSSPGTLCKIEIAASRKGIKIRIKKGPAVPVAVYPGGCYKPAGAFFPMDMSEDGVLIVKIEKGFLAELLLSLYPEKSRLEAVNIVKLQDLVMEKSGGDPWSIDPDKLRLSLVLGSISSFKVRVMDKIDVVIPEAFGKWIPDNPFLPPCNSSGDGTLPLSLYSGISSLYNREERKILSVSVSGEDYEYIISQQY